MSPRKSLDESDRFKGISDAEKGFMQGDQPKPSSERTDSSQTSVEKPKADRTAKQSKTASKADIWSELKQPEKEPSIRLNVDIPISLNDKLAERARLLRQPKTELVRKLLEWALDESIE